MVKKSISKGVIKDILIVAVAVLVIYLKFKDIIIHEIC